MSQADPHVLELDNSGAPPAGWVNPRKGFLFFLGFAAIGAGASAQHPQNFTALFLPGAIAGVLGAALILPIRKVR